MIRASIADHPSFELHHAETEDGWRLALKRYPRHGAPPVVLVHGLAQDCSSFDLPVPGHSLARYLHGSGLDVWLPNLRSHGRPPFVSQCSGLWDWSIDDHALRDLPAILDRVRQETGRPPFYIGHSMGGMALLMYLQGAHRPEGAERIAACPELRDARHRGLAGGITLGSPVLIQWDSPRGAIRWLSTLLDSRNLIRLAGNRRWVKSLLLALGYAPTRRLLEELHGSRRLHWISLRKLFAWPLGQANKLLARGHIWHPDNMTPEIFAAALRTTMSHCCTRVLVQFLDWISSGRFREFPEPGADGLYDYAAGLRRIDLPLLMVAGEHDHFTDRQVLQREGFGPLGSPDKSLVVLPRTGHADILYGKHVPSTLYPLLVAWIRKRCPDIPVAPTKRLKKLASTT